MNKINRPFLFLIFSFILLAKNSFADKSKDSLKLVHTAGIGAKAMNRQEYGQERLSVGAKYNAPAIDVFYNLNFLKKKRKFIAVNATFSYYTGHINWGEDYHTGSYKYSGNFQFLRWGLGLTRGIKLTKDGSLCLGYGFDIQATIYSNNVDYYSWYLVSNPSGYSNEYINTKESLNNILKPVRVLWKAELVKYFKISTKLKAMVGLKFTVSRHDFDEQFSYNPMTCGGLNFGICF